MWLVPPTLLWFGNRDVERPHGLNTQSHPLLTYDSANNVIRHPTSNANCCLTGGEHSANAADPLRLGPALLRLRFLVPTGCRLHYSRSRIAASALLSYILITTTETKTKTRPVRLHGTLETRALGIQPRTAFQSCNHACHRNRGTEEACTDHLRNKKKGEPT